jgi:hypothetical protein
MKYKVTTIVVVNFALIQQLRYYSEKIKPLLPLTIHVWEISL